MVSRAVHYCFYYDYYNYYNKRTHRVNKPTVPLWTWHAMSTCSLQCLTGGRKHGVLRLQKPLRLIRDGEVGGSGIFTSNTYSLQLSQPEWLCMKVGSCVSYFNVWVICVGKVTRQCPQTTIFEEKGEPKRIEPRLRVESAGFTCSRDVRRGSLVS